MTENRIQFAPFLAKRGLSLHSYKHKFFERKKAGNFGSYFRVRIIVLWL